MNKSAQVAVLRSVTIHEVNTAHEKLIVSSTGISDLVATLMPDNLDDLLVLDTYLSQMRLDVGILISLHKT